MSAPFLIWGSGWFSSILESGPVIQFVLSGAGLFAIFRYLQDRRDTLNREADQRFMTAATALSSSENVQRMAGAVMLRTFLTGSVFSRSMKRFHPMIFDLSVGLFRSRPAAGWEENEGSFGGGSYHEPSVLETSFYQSLVPGLTTAMALSATKSVPKPELGLDGREMRLDWIRVEQSNLSRVCFAGSSLIHSSVVQTLAHSSDWSSVKAYESNFTDVDLTASRVWRAELTRFSVADSAVKNVYFMGTELTNCGFYRTEMNDCDFESIHCKNTIFEDCQINNSNFYLARFRESGFFRCNLSGADLLGAKFLEKCDLRECNLSGANLQAVVLNGVDLSGSDFTGVNFMAINSMNSAQMYDVKGINDETMSYLVDQWGVYTNQIRSLDDQDAIN